MWVEDCLSQKSFSLGIIPRNERGLGSELGTGRGEDRHFEELHSNPYLFVSLASLQVDRNREYSVEYLRQIFTGILGPNILLNIHCPHKRLQSSAN